MTEQRTPSQQLGLTILKMVRERLTTDALTRAIERADERYTEAALQASNWAGNNPEGALDVMSVLLGGIRNDLLVNGDQADIAERREAVENALVALEDLTEAFNGIHEPQGEPVAAP